MESNTHIIAVPYPGRGHINPLINACRLIAFRGPSITIVVTEEWLGLLSAMQFPPNVSLRSIPNVLPSELTRGGDPEGFFDAVMTKMVSPFESLLDEPDFQHTTAILADVGLPWAVTVGNRRSIPVYNLWTESASDFSILYYGHQVLCLDFQKANLVEIGEETVSYFPGINSIKISDLHSTFFKPPLKLNIEAFSKVNGAQGLFFSSFYELESDVIDALSSILPFPLYPIGPLIPLPKSIPLNSDADHYYYTWLDSQPKNSVLYISFGSFLPLSGSQMDEIVKGLNLSGIRYMWVIRENLCQETGFSSDKGITVPWCNQLDVLCHTSVGGFLTHCGWNSVLEGLYAGVPMITFPLLFDQFPNSKMIADDLKVGLRLKMQNQNLVGRGEIARLVRMVMDLDGEESKKLRGRAEEIKGKCNAALEEGGSSFANLDAFISTLKGHSV